MLTPIRVMVLVIILIILMLATWSKLKFLDEDSDGPQRWRVEDYPGFKNYLNGN